MQRIRWQVRQVLSKDVEKIAEKIPDNNSRKITANVDLHGIYRKNCPPHPPGGLESKNIY